MSHIDPRVVRTRAAVVATTPVIDAVRSLKPPLDSPDTGSVRGDVLGLLRQLRDALQHSRWGELLPVLVDASFREHEMFERHRAVAREGRGWMRSVLERLGAPSSTGTWSAGSRSATPTSPGWSK